MDRAYIDYGFFEQLTEQGVFYVTKMKKNLRYEQQEGNYLVNTAGKVVMYDTQIELKKDEIVHQSRLIKYWDQAKKKEQVLLTNNFELHADQIVLIYLRRWQIETLFKQLKQNFPLKYFFGESVNAIQSQIWITLIANLLLSVIKRKIKRKWSFSNLVTMVRQCLMYYIDLYKFSEDPEKTWLDIINKPPQQYYCADLFDN